MSEAFTTLGWVIRVSQAAASNAATGVASPAWPPISAPTPVGTSNTQLKAAVFSRGRRANRNIEGRLVAFSPAARPTSQRYSRAEDEVTAMRMGTSPGGQGFLNSPLHQGQGSRAPAEPTGIATSLSYRTADISLPPGGVVFVGELLYQPVLPACLWSKCWAG